MQCRSVRVKLNVSLLSGNRKCAYISINQVDKAKFTHTLKTFNCKQVLLAGSYMNLSRLTQWSSVTTFKPSRSADRDRSRTLSVFGKAACIKVNLFPPMMETEMKRLSCNSPL